MPDQNGMIRPHVESLTLAKELQKHHPEIGDWFRRGLFQSEIIERLHIVDRYEVDISVARSAVSYALRGYSANGVMKGFNGLIPRNELVQILEDHNVQNGKRVGRESFLDKKGAFAMSEKKRRTVSISAGKKGGASAYKNGKGFHALSSEERAANGRLSAINAGKALWVLEADGRPSEKDRAYELSLDSKYQRGSLTSCIRIAETLDREYHGGEKTRSPKAVQKVLDVRRKEERKEERKEAVA